MDSGKQSVRLLMQKERERRERVRRQAAAAASAIQPEPKQQDAGVRTPSVAHEPQGHEKTTAIAALSPSPEQASRASLPAASDSRIRAKAELRAKFFDAHLSAPHADTEVARFSDAAAVAVDAKVLGARVVVECPTPPAGAKEGVEALEEVEEEEGVIFEIEEPDESLLLPLHVQSLLDPTGENHAQMAKAAQTGDTISDPAGLPEPANVPSSDQTGATLPRDISEGISGTVRHAAVSGITNLRQRRTHARVHPIADPSLVPGGASEPATTPSAATSALLSSVTGDELRWYRPFDTAFHSELLHEEEELAQLQRDIQVAAEKRAAAAREAASTAAAAAVAAAAADANTSQRNEAAGEFALTKQRLVKRKAAAEATAATPAAAEVAATAAAAATEKHAAAIEALLGKARAAKAARLAQQRQKAPDDAPVPWGFFDDEEREAAMRGFTGPKRLQELLQRAEERRRDMAEDLQERKQDWLRHREDVRRFVLRVEEQVQDASVYQMRVERLKEKRKIVLADAERSTHTATKGEAPPVGETPNLGGAAQVAERPSTAIAHAVSSARVTTGGEDASADVKRELKNRVKTEQQELPGNLDKNSRKTTPGDSTTVLRRGGDSDTPVDGSMTSLSSQKAEPGGVKLQSSKDAELSEYIKHKFLMTHSLTPATVGDQAMHAKQEMLPISNPEQPKSLQATLSRLEDGGTNITDEEDDEELSGEDDDDSRWRAKSLLTFFSVPDK